MHRRVGLLSSAIRTWNIPVYISRKLYSYWKPPSCGPWGGNPCFCKSACGVFAFLNSSFPAANCSHWGKTFLMPSPHGALAKSCLPHFFSKCQFLKQEDSNVQTNFFCFHLCLELHEEFLLYFWSFWSHGVVECYNAHHALWHTEGLCSLYRRDMKCPSHRAFLDLRYSDFFSSICAMHLFHYDSQLDIVHLMRLKCSGALSLKK